MASKKDAALELGENLLRVLHEQRALGADAYPLTVKRLTEHAKVQATPAQIEKALNKQSFKSQPIVRRRKDPQAGRHNFVSLLDLRAALPFGRELFDAELHKLRLGGKYSLSAAEGRLGLSPEEHAAGILEEGTLMLYVSAKKIDLP